MNCLLTRTSSLLLIFFFRHILIRVESSAPGSQKSYNGHKLPVLGEAVDVVITVSAADRRLKFLEPWREMIQMLHIIFILEENVLPEKVLVPDWADYELYSYEDIKKTLGEKYLKFVCAPHGPSLRNFAVWVSDRSYILFLDSSIAPLRPQAASVVPLDSDAIGGNAKLNIVEQLLYNLMVNSNFTGSPIAVTDANRERSKWLHYSNPEPDRHRAGIAVGCISRSGGGRAVDISTATATVTTTAGVNSTAGNPFMNMGDVCSQPFPKGQMDGITLPQNGYYNFFAEKLFMIDRLVVAHVIMFPPFLDSVSSSIFDQSLRAEQFTSVIVKILFDYVSVGVKVVPNVIVRRIAHKSPEGVIRKVLTPLEQPADPVLNHPEVVEYFQTVILDENKLKLNERWTLPWRTCPGRYHSLKFEDYNRHLECFQLQLVRKAARLLNKVDPLLFKFLDESINGWAQVWMLRWMNGLATYGQEPIRPLASRSSLAPYSRTHSQCALMTMVRNEFEMLPYWLRYYTRHVIPQDIYIFDHFTSDNSTHPSKLPPGVKIISLYSNPNVMPVFYRSDVVHDYQDRLMRSGYKCSIFTDTDEIIVPNPNYYPGGLREYLGKFINDSKKEYYRVTAWEVGHLHFGNETPGTQEPPFNWSDPYLFHQRSIYNPDPRYNKPILTKSPLSYRPGFHHLYDKTMVVPQDDKLILWHMTSFDFHWCNWKAELHYNLSKLMAAEDARGGFATHWERYHHFKKKGVLCQFADGSFVGPLTNKTKYRDGTGTLKMHKIPPEFRDVLV